MKRKLGFLTFFIFLASCGPVSRNQNIGGSTSDHFRVSLQYYLSSDKVKNYGSQGRDLVVSKYPKTSEKPSQTSYSLEDDLVLLNVSYHPYMEVENKGNPDSGKRFDLEIRITNKNGAPTNKGGVLTSYSTTMGQYVFLYDLGTPQNFKGHKVDTLAVVYSLSKQ